MNEILSPLVACDSSQRSMKGAASGSTSALHAVASSVLLGYVKVDGPRVFGVLLPRSLVPFPTVPPNLANIAFLVMKSFFGSPLFG